MATMPKKTIAYSAFEVPGNMTNLIEFAHFQDKMSQDGYLKNPIYTDFQEKMKNDMQVLEEWNLRAVDMNIDKSPLFFHDSDRERARKLIEDEILASALEGGVPGSKASTRAAERKIL